MRAANRITRVVLAGIAAAAAVPADAAEGGWRWYYSAGIPVTNLESSSFVADAAAAGYVVTDEIGDVTIGGQGTLGVMVTDKLGAEVRYAASGNARDTPTITNLTAPSQTGSSKLDIDGITVYAVGSWPLSERVDLLGKLGYTFQDLDLDADFPQVFVPGPAGEQGDLVSDGIHVSDDDDGFAAALGVRFQTGERWAVIAEVEYLDVDFDNQLDEPIRGSLNLEYTF